MAYCSHCGSALPAEALYCSVCGTRQDAEADNDGAGEEYLASAVDASEPGEEIVSQRTAHIAVLIGGLACAAGGFLPWESVRTGLGTITRSGIELTTSDGWAVIGIGTLLALSAISALTIDRRARLGEVIAVWAFTLVVAGIVAYDLSQLEARTRTIAALDVGGGMYLLLFGLAALGFGGFSLACHQTKRRLGMVIGVIGAGALLLIAGAGFSAAQPTPSATPSVGASSAAAPDTSTATNADNGNLTPDTSGASSDTSSSTSNASANSFGDGTYRVGTDIQPGLYQVTNVDGCYWERLSKISDTFSTSNVIASDNAAGNITVQIKPNDVGFETRGCGSWAPLQGASANPATSFGDGTYAVGKQIAAGMYTTAGGDNCYWERSGDLGGASTLTNYLGGGHNVVVINPGDGGFKTKGCGLWAEADTSTANTGGGATSFGNGIWRVGGDIATGSYHTDGQDSCYYAVLSNFTGKDDIIKNDNTNGPVNITLDDTTEGIESKGCGTWVTVHAVCWRCGGQMDYSRGHARRAASTTRC